MSGHREAVVIGGGQAGLAVGYHLARQDREFTIIEAAAAPGAAWRERWDSLTLFTPIRYDSLPGRRFPGDPDRYPTRDEVADYLADYARHFELPVELGRRVESVRAHDSGYLVATDAEILEADQVIVATGPFQVPRIPAMSATLDPSVVQMHSSGYRTPATIAAGPVLVVGGGNTGFQIAEELARTHQVTLSIGSRQMPLPQRLLGRDLFHWLEATRLMNAKTESRIGRRMRARDTLIGSSPRALRRRHQVALRGRAIAAAGSEIAFDDDTRLAVSTVIWATGFGLDHSWIDAPVFDAGGAVVHERGVTASPGLYFLGLPWLHTRGSALLGWIKDDAEHIAGHVEARAKARAGRRAVNA